MLPTEIPTNPDAIPITLRKIAVLTPTFTPLKLQSEYKNKHKYNKSYSQVYVVHLHTYIPIPVVVYARSYKAAARCLLLIMSRFPRHTLPRVDCEYPILLVRYKLPIFCKDMRQSALFVQQLSLRVHVLIDWWMTLGYLTHSLPREAH